MSTSPLKVHIITQNEPFYIPKVVRHLLEQENESYKISCITVLAPHRKNKSYKDWFKERSSIYTYYELMLVGFMFVYCKLFKKYYSVPSLIKEFDINELKTTDVNSNDFCEAVTKENIDVILSISPPQIFKLNLIKSVKYCLNAHGTLLPRHRGVFGSWWMLNCNDEEIGSTIHHIDEGLDTGSIVWQEAVRMPDNPTQYKIAYLTKRLIAKGLIESLVSIHNGGINSKDPEFEESYHRAPTIQEAKKFRNEGKSIIRFANLKLALSKRF